LILDEATSSIDVRGEKVVQAALDRVSKNRTTIMIAHRLATVKKADNIVVLAKGKVVQWGNHESLMAAVGGPYWLLTQSQELKMGDRAEDAYTQGHSDDLSEDTVTEEEKRTMDLMTLDESSGSKKANELATGDGEGAGSEPAWKPRGVFRSFGTLLLEQENCSHWYILMLFGALIAGVMLPYLSPPIIRFYRGRIEFALTRKHEASPPVQAYIFANLIASFSLWGELLRIVTEFWCLMFVALAAAAALSYFCLGFASTRVAFVSYLNPPSLQKLENMLSNESLNR
jgi:ATP-binding cassette, subfamily B (MDR/TAP), member 1